MNLRLPSILAVPCDTVIIYICNISAINSKLLDKSGHIIHSSLKLWQHSVWHSKILVELNDELKIIITANITMCQALF